MRRYLVTGGTGFIGSAIVLKLLADGHFVRVFDNDLRGSSTKFSGIADNIELINGDIRDAGTVDNACSNIDSVIHLAYLNGTEYFYSHPHLVLEIAVKGMMNVVDGCINNGVKELVLASSSEVYQTPPVIPTDETAPLIVPDPLNPRYSYGGGKIICELIAINYGRKFFDRVIIFRPHNVIGPDMGTEHVIPQFALRLKELVEVQKNGSIEFPIQGTGKETRAFIYIDDFVEAVSLLLKKGEHLNVYHIGTQDEVSIEGLAIEVGKIYGRQIKIVASALTQGSTLRRSPNIGKMMKLGFVPTTSFSKAIEKTVSWYKTNQVITKRIN